MITRRSLMLPRSKMHGFVGRKRYAKVSFERALNLKWCPETGASSSHLDTSQLFCNNFANREKLATRIGDDESNSKFNTPHRPPGCDKMWRNLTNVTYCLRPLRRSSLLVFFYWRVVPWGEGFPPPCQLGYSPSVPCRSRRRLFSGLQQKKKFLLNIVIREGLGRSRTN